ncbi:MAG: ABC transporter permease [Desulfurococcales archaeon]|nr:ABC transporter permease [Desulfurococcales archaeon]
MAELKRFLVRRLITFIPTLVGVTFIVFVIAAVIPANPARLWAGGEKANPEVVERLVREYHLNENIFKRYYFIMSKLLKNEMVSPVTQHYIWDDLKKFFPVTFQLTLIAFAFIVLIGIPLGILAALKRDTALDTAVRILALVGVSTPIFWLAYLMIFVFFTKYRLITLAGIPTPPYSITGIPLIDAILKGDLGMIKEILARFALPSFILGFAGIGITARIVRNSFLDSLSADYTEYAMARGLSKLRVYRHVLKNAMVPIVTVLGLMFGGLLGGAPITEQIFGLRGLGWYMLQAIRNFDYLALVGAVFFVALIYLTVNLIVDILYAFIDPRVRY